MSLVNSSAADKVISRFRCSGMWCFNCLTHEVKTVLQNVVPYLPNNVTSHPRRPKSSAVVLQETLVLQDYISSEPVWLHLISIGIMLPLVSWCDTTCTYTVLSRVATALVLVLSHCCVETDTVLNDHTLFWWADFTILDQLVFVRVKWLWYITKSSVENSLYWFMAVQVGTDHWCTRLLWC